MKRVVGVCALPTHEQFTNCLENLPSKALSEDIGLLIFRGNLEDADVTFLNMSAEEVILDGDVFRARRHTGHRSQNESALVVFEDLGVCADLEGLVKLQGVRHFLNQSVKR